MASGDEKRLSYPGPSEPSGVRLVTSHRLDAVIAWRIMLLALLGREMPELPADVLFDAEEREVLGLLTQKKDSPSVRR